MLGHPHNIVLNSLIVDPADQHVLCSGLPFSQSLTQDDLILLAKELLSSLDLSAHVRFVRGGGSLGLHYERLFRLNWWASGREPLRGALQHAKAKIYSRVDATGNWDQLTKVWQLTDRLVTSQEWRAHLSLLVEGLSSAEYSYLRLVHQISQQAWSRAARWIASGPVDTACPFLPLLKLLMAKALPLGYYDGYLWIFLWDRTATYYPEFPLRTWVQPAEYSKGHIFLSTQFRDTELTERWKDSFHRLGWSTLHGPVNEEIVPPELQLGKRIQTARAVVALIDEIDVDFGLPWWMFQELDYACAAKKPAALVSQSSMIDERLRTVQCFKSTDREMWNPTQEHELWVWLKTHAL